MDIVLIPGLWLTGDSWEAVAADLDGAGHTTHPLTLPGMESSETDRTAVSLQDHIDAVIDVVDRCEEGKVLLVGHSAGGGVAHAVVDARPDRIARVIYVGGFPAGDGEAIVGGFETSDGDLPLPAWDAFDDADLTDLDREARDRFRERAVPSPAAYATETVRLTDSRRYDVPVTVVATEFTSEGLNDWMAREPGELTQITHVEYVDLPTGHWPQITRPGDLAATIAERAVEPLIDEHGRIHPPVEAGEELTLLGFLDYQRATLAWKTRGLDSGGLTTKTASSALTLGGLLKHMAYVEDYWFGTWLHGREPAPPWDGVDWKADRDWDFNSAASDSPDELQQLWRQATWRSRALTAAALADGGLGRLSTKSAADGARVSLRWIMAHMIEEYARHNGHADLLREVVDGQTGE